MMQEYEFQGADTLSATAVDTVLPSEQVLQNILNFARCYQTVETEGFSMQIFLN